MSDYDDEYDDDEYSYDDEYDEYDELHTEYFEDGETYDPDGYYEAEQALEFRRFEKQMHAWAEDFKQHSSFNTSSVELHPWAVKLNVKDIVDFSTERLLFTSYGDPVLNLDVHKHKVVVYAERPENLSPLFAVEWDHVPAFYYFPNFDNQQQYLKSKQYLITSEVWLKAIT